MTDQIHDSAARAARINQPEPPPQHTGGIPIWKLVIADMHERDQTGRQRYGTPLQAHNGRDALIDAYQEALDQCVYLRQEIEERRERKDNPPSFSTQVREFHAKFGVPHLSRPRVIESNRADLRKRLIFEELDELVEAMNAGDLVGIADGIADLHYVISGTALEYGIPEDAVFSEVHRSNMSKVFPDGKVHYRADGKVLKPPTYSPADIASILEHSGSDDGNYPIDVEAAAEIEYRAEQAERAGATA